MSATPNPLMPSERAVHHWTTTNLGEAAPGVLTPLSLALWGETAERASRRAAFGIGVLRSDETEPPPDPADWVLRPFYGRLAMQLEFMALIGDRMPGVSGEDAIRGMFGEAPASMEFSPTRARFPAIAGKLTRSFLTTPGRVRKLAAEQDSWWRSTIAAVDGLDLAGARRAFGEAQRRFDHSSSTQLLTTLSTIQPLYDALGALVGRAGTGDGALLSGVGGAEMEIVTDIWRGSRGELEISDIARAHGFHGPLEGEISSRVWREDDAPLRALVERYESRPDDEDPRRREAEKREALDEMQGDVLAALPRWMRPAGGPLLRLAADRIPLRGVAKRSFLQAIDVARASARRAGEELAREGVLSEPEDVFMLTGPELLGALPADPAALVAERRGLREEYERVRFASTEWLGLPELVASTEPQEDRSTGSITGTGVSAGVVEGTVHVVTDPSFEDIEPDAVLVAPTTDPSWSSIMFISSALVVDMGGALSHAAVVARELGIPCVVDTGDGTRVLATGDRVRVDGNAGTVEILSRA